MRYQGSYKQRNKSGVQRVKMRTGKRTMKTISASEARANLYRLLDEAAVSSEPIHITGKRAGAVLVSEEDWRAIQETLYLMSIPGMTNSIKRGLKTPLKKCVESLDW